MRILDEDNPLGIRIYPGYIGAFTTQTVPGAMSNGTRVTKTASEAGDGAPDGTGGVVLGSVEHPDRGIGYFIEWDSTPKVAVLVVALKVMAVGGSA